MGKKNIMPKNEKGKSHGYHEAYDNDVLSYKCHYLNDELVGYDEDYDMYDDILSFKAYHLI